MCDNSRHCAQYNANSVASNNETISTAIHFKLGNGMKLNRKI